MSLSWLWIRFFVHKNSSKHHEYVQHPGRNQLTPKSGGFFPEDANMFGEGWKKPHGFICQTRKNIRWSRTKGSYIMLHPPKLWRQTNTFCEEGHVLVFQTENNSPGLHLPNGRRQAFQTLWLCRQRRTDDAGLVKMAMLSLNGTSCVFYNNIYIDIYSNNMQ